MYAAAAPEQGLQPLIGEVLADPPGGGAAILAELVAEIHQLTLRSAAFEQQPAAQQGQRFHSAGFADKQGAIA